MFRRAAFALLLVFALSGASANVRADSTQSAALTKFEAGKTAFDAGQFEQALIEFQASVELQPSPNTRLYIGRCLRALGKPAGAYTNFRVAAREAQDRLNATGEKRYTATRDAATSEAAEIEAKVPRLTVALPSDLPQGFTVKLNGVEVPRGAWGVAVETDPGNYQVLATAPRFSTFSEKFALAEGEQKQLQVRLTKLPTATLVLKFASRPSGVAAMLDGKPLDPTELERRRELDVGRHKVEISAPGYVPFVWQKDLANEQQAEVLVTLRAEARPRGGPGAGKGTPKWLFFGVAGASLVALGAGTIIAIDASGSADEETAKDPLVRDPDVQDTIRSQGTLANILFGAGAVLGVGAGVLAFTTEWKSPASEPGPVAFAPWLGRSGGGVGAFGRFQ